MLYKMLQNPTEKEVNKVLNEGYYLHTVNLSPAHGLFGVALIYHFVKNKYEQASKDDFNIVNIMEEDNLNTEL